MTPFTNPPTYSTTHYPSIYNSTSHSSNTHNTYSLPSSHFPSILNSYLPSTYQQNALPHLGYSSATYPSSHTFARPVLINNPPIRSPSLYASSTNENAYPYSYHSNTQPYFDNSTN